MLNNIEGTDVVHYVCVYIHTQPGPLIPIIFINAGFRLKAAIIGIHAGTYQNMH